SRPTAGRCPNRLMCKRRAQCSAVPPCGTAVPRPGSDPERGPCGTVQPFQRSRGGLFTGCPPRLPSAPRRVRIVPVRPLELDCAVLLVDYELAGLVGHGDLAPLLHRSILGEVFG